MGALLLVAYLGIVYGDAVTLPFLNDDYFFLDKVRRASFVDLWKPEQLIFHWYRPWSRELHYWILFRFVGLNEVAYHIASFALWLAVIVLYFLLVQRLAGRAAAAIATAGVAALGLWSGPLLWIAGAQDLWMLLFSLLFLHAIARDRPLAAIPLLLLALFSKETAAVLPAVATILLYLTGRRTLPQALRRTLGLWVVLVVWMLFHPTLSDRLFGSLQHSLETEIRPTATMTLARTLLAQLNLEDRIAPEMGWGPVLRRGALGSAILGAWLVLSLRHSRSGPRPQVGAVGHGRAILFGSLWAVAGWTILFLPSIGWHAYYGVLGSLGCWLTLGTALQRYPRAAVALILALATLREARAATPSWDWGTDWYQRRAGALLGDIREKLFQLHPAFPPHSRLFFAELPNNIGLLAGDGPAIRVWYGDPSLKGRYYSAYTPRAAGDSLGGDYFFLFDSLRVLREVHPGPEATRLAMRRSPTWHRDHAVLASLFIHAGDIRGAASEYAKLWQAFPERPDYALYAGAAYEALGAIAEARTHYRAAARAYGDSVVRAYADSLVRDARAYRDPTLPERTQSRDPATLSPAPP
jgi:hypothetical protein